MDKMNHPIVKPYTKVKVIGKTERTGIWQPAGNWERLTVDTGEGVIVENVRHRSAGSYHAFQVEVGDVVSIVYWEDVAEGLEPWYYTSKP